MKRITVSLIVIITFGFAQAEIIYSNGFESSVGSEWSSNKITQAPFGQKFLGDWSNDTISLSLSDIPQHTEITLEFDLHIIYSMDGNWGDMWSLSIQDGPVLLYTTFSNPLGSVYTPQSYPGNYPSEYPQQTGASAINSLGYNTVSNGYINPVFGDSTYHLIYTFEHQPDSLIVNFQGSGMGYQGTGNLEDESWGIDNVIVEAVPEPATLLTLALGSLMLRKRR